MEMQDQTSEYIAGYFKKACASSPLDKISITSICTGCNINRSTFYYYFESKESLIRWIIHNDIDSNFMSTDMITWKQNVLHLLHTKALDLLLP